jgi:hypothetical protein
MCRKGAPGEAYLVTFGGAFGAITGSVSLPELVVAGRSVGRLVGQGGPSLEEPIDGSVGVGDGVVFVHGHSLGAEFGLECCA